MLDRIKVEITEELRRSDIVWPKYGSTSVDQLAEQITVRVGAIVEGKSEDWTPVRDTPPLDGPGIPFPMPGTLIGERRVIASCEYINDERGAIALVLLLNEASPYFTVSHYALTDVRGGDTITPYAAGELDVIGTFENIVPAVEEYGDNGGDY